MKNKFFTILLALTLSMPVMAFSEEDLQKSGDLTPTVTQEEVANNKIQYKQPVSKRKIAKRFLLAMSGVGISSILLFGLLTLYNKVRENILEAEKEIPPNGETSLVTPDNTTEAVITFLEKTKWKN